MTIPIQNIYYLLCYAWNKLEVSQHVQIDADNYSNIESLFAKVLVESSNRLFKRGLAHDYVEVEHDIAGIKGRVDFNSSLKKQLFRQGRAFCRHDEFTSDILSNQIIKATMIRLVRLDSINAPLRKELRQQIDRLQGISDIILDHGHFRNVRIHSNNAFYEFLLNVCELVYHSTAVQERGSNSRFQDFLRDEKKMAGLFEAFIRNFYRQEQSRYNTGADHIEWQFAADSMGNHELFPLMKTDITLCNTEEKHIIEVKYYSETLTSHHYGSDRLRSSHLYQLFAYLTNLSLDRSHPGNRTCSGILLYPTVNIQMDETYQLANHRLRIYTLNLNQPWQGIREDLLSLLPSSK
jgi:5-methylcytosine-specific restriction enzyme subunit McrC